MQRTVWLFGISSFLLGALCCPPARGALIINEVFVNPPGADNGFEYFEIRETTNGVQGLTGFHLVIIEGDGAGAGTLDVALNLAGFSTGANGLFLWRDAATVLLPAPEASTNVNVADFTPDLENGSSTFFLVSGFTGAVGADLDTNNDGVLDTTPWASVVDSIGNVENDGTANIVYSSAANSIGSPTTTFSPDFLARDSITLALIGGDALGSASGPYNVDQSQFVHNGGATTLSFTNLTPGSANFAGLSAVPEPSSLALMGIVSSALIIRRFRGRKAQATY